MRKSLKAGDRGPDVSLLQTRLNALPTALPRLVVDGHFGPLTLQRVDEFQRNEFVHDAVDAATWARLLPSAADGAQTFHTLGRFLFDPAGNKIILRGVNKMSVWDFNDPTGAVYFPEIRKTGANSVRIVWTMVDDHGAPTDPARLDALITNAWGSQLIPMVELHDATGNWNRLQELVDYWVQPAVVALIQKHQAYLLVNIGNEVGNDKVSSGEFISGYTAAVAQMRAAGIRTPLVIDAPQWGQGIEILNATAHALINADPSFNLVFSVHTYWSSDCGYDAQAVRGRLETAAALGYPLIVGEVSKFGGYPCKHEGASICGPDGEIEYQTVLQVCQEQQIGWFAWEWGPGNALGDPPDPLCTAMDMTTDGLFAHIQPGWAEEVALALAQSAPPPPPPEAAGSITAEPGGSRADPEGVAQPEDVSLLKWKDSRYADRTLTLGGYLHQYDFSFHDNNEVVTRTANDDVWGHPGFGYVVSHNVQNGNSPLGKANVPVSVDTQVYSGGHHALHRIALAYERDKEEGGKGIVIPVVIQWFVATGRDHPVWAVTWKMDEAQHEPDVDFDIYRMDVRAPYGSLNFDGAPNRQQGDAIGGVAWGDCGFRFATTDAQLNLNSSWTYNTPNSVNFVQAWTATANAEMGIVQTRVLDKELGFPDRVVPWERNHTSADKAANPEMCDCIGWTDERKYLLPCVNGWPYQLMNYDWDPGAAKPPGESTGTKLLGWGAPYGWLGASSFFNFDYSGTAAGTGDRCYATFIVLGPKHRFGPQNEPLAEQGDVSIAIAEVEALAAAAVSGVAKGTLASEAPKGPGANSMKSIANGYDDTYAAYRLKADDNQVSFTLTPGAGKPVHNPVFVIEDYTAPGFPQILVGGNPVTVNAGAESGAYVSMNAAANELWLTLHETVSLATSVQISAAPPG
jgi:mannan endo-1,4-beta-mannosidase